VYDPALKNGIYNVEVYVPGGALQALPKGVPQGADACNCRALFKSGAVVSTATGIDGSFTLKSAPVGQQIPLVLQVGKWRRVVHVDTTQCSDAPQPDKSLSLPGTVAPGSDDNMPDIAVSTGNADTLECLMKRIGLPDSEYVAGTANTGHVHVFSGGAPSGGATGVLGSPEMPPMPGAPASATDLWDAPVHLMPYDILLLSCEGGETYNANPAALEEYLNAGGRTFASHYHYAWFAGPISSRGRNTYAPPADWGNALATWSPSGGAASTTSGQIVQTLNGSTNPFPKGLALDQWLGHNGALGVQGALTIYNARFNSVVGPGNKPSQPWIQDNISSQGTMLFSFDTPVNASVDPATGLPSYCGRGVFGDLHAAGTYNQGTQDRPPTPGGCQATDLSPQEKVLEFMLFDLSSCVIPDSVAPPDGGILGP
jgi:hypothetical protein